MESGIIKKKYRIRGERRNEIKDKVVIYLYLFK